MPKDEGEAAYIVDADVFDQTPRKLIIAFLFACRAAEVGADDRSSALVSRDFGTLVSEVRQQGDAAVSGEA